MKGQYFAGWGYMRFWIAERSDGQQHIALRGTSLQGSSEGHDCDVEQICHGRSHEAFIATAQTILGASPLEMRLERWKSRHLHS